MGQVKYLRETTRRRTRINVLVPANRWGKDVCNSTPVLLSSGEWKLIGDIVAGDEVISQDGTPTKVTDVFPQGKKPLYRVTFNDGTSVLAGLDHAWWVMSPSNRFKKHYSEADTHYSNKTYRQYEEKTTREILDHFGSHPKPSQRYAIPRVEPVQLKEKPTPIHPYALGVLLGDGCLTKGPVWSKPEPQIADEVEKYHKISKCKNDVFRILNKISEFTLLGLQGKRSWEKFVPRDYLTNSVENRLALLQGLLDTDGSINTGNKQIEISTASKQLSKDITYLVQSLGGTCRVYPRDSWYTYKGKRKEGRKSYRCKIDIRLCPFRLERKKKLFEEKQHFYSGQRIITSIVYEKDEESTCIRVDHPSHLFVINDFIVTHNSSLVACLQIWYLFYKFGIPEGNEHAWRKAEYRTANIAPQSTQTEAVFKAIHQILTSSYAIKTPDNRLTTNQCFIGWFYLKSRTLNTPPYKQYFANNSYIEHRSLGADQGDSLQGKPYGLITYDEGGRSLHLKEEVMGNIMPRLGDWVGPFHLLSTPDSGSPSILYHYELYKNGLAGIKSTYTQEGSLKENLLFGEAQIKEQYDLYKDDPIGTQVLDGAFIFGGDNIFPIDDIQAAQDESLDNGKRHQSGHTYIISSDTAIGADEMVHSVLDVTNLKVTESNGVQQISGAAELVRQSAVKGNSKSPQQHLNDFIDLYDSYREEGHSIMYMLETFNGESVRWYHDLPMYIQTNTTCYGTWQPERRITDNKNQAKNKTNNIKKIDILMAGQKILSARALKIFKNDPNKHHDGASLDQQLSIYKEDDHNIPTDRVISLCLAAWGAIQSRKVQEIRFIDM